MADFDLATLGIRIDASDGKTAASTLDNLTKSGGLAATAVKYLGAAVAGIGLLSLANQSKELAARFESTGLVMRIAGNNAGYFNSQMLETQKAFERTSFTMNESRDAAIKLAVANIDLSKAQELAILSQDLAAAANIEATQALETLRSAIVSGREVALKQMGLNVDFETSYIKLALSIGKTTDQLTDTEKAQVRLNAVLGLAPSLAGAFEENLKGLSGQTSELAEDWENFQTKLGAASLPAAKFGVQLLRDAIIVLDDALTNTTYIVEKLQAGFNSLFFKPKIVTAVDLPLIGKDSSNIANEASRVAKAKEEKEAIAAAQAKAIADKEAAKVIKEKTDATNDFIKSLTKETLQVGLTSLEAHKLNSEYQASIAPTKALAAAILELETAYQSESLAAEGNKLFKEANINVTNKFKEAQKSQIEFAKEMLSNLKFENEQIGKNAEQIARATAIRELETQGIIKGTAAWELYGKAIVEAAAVQGKSAFNVQEAQAYLSILERVESRTREAAANMADAFGNVGRAIGGVTVAFAANASRQAAIQSKLEADQAKYGKESVAGKKAEAMATREAMASELKYNGDVLGAAKQAFGEKTAMFKALQAAETVYRVFQMAQAIQSMIVDANLTISSIFNSKARATADGSAAMAKTAASLPFPFNLAAMAAMGAALVAAGVAIFGGGGGSATVPGATDRRDRQEAQGTGSVLGDKSEKSNSILNSLEIVSRNSNTMLEYQSSMTSSLKSIKENIGGLTTLIARQLSVASGIFDTSKLGIGSSGSNFLGLFGSKKTVSLQDLGIEFGTQSIGSIVAQGIVASTYQQLLTTKSSSFLGFGSTSSSVSTVSSSLDADLKKQLQTVVAGLKAGVLDVAGTIGLEGAERAINSFNISIGKLSLDGLKGSEINEALTAVFSKVADDISAKIIPGIAQLQRVGEGAFETATRLAREYQVVDFTLASLAKSFGSVGIASIGARSRLVELAGGLDEFTEGTKFVLENFFTDAQQLQPIILSVSGEMRRLGASSVTTKDQFAVLIRSIDVSTKSGSELFAALLRVAPAFSRVADEVKKTADAYREAASNIRGTLSEFTNASRAQSLTAARSAFTRGLEQARSGDLQALNNLSSLARNFAEASNSNASSAISFARDRAIVRIGLENSASIADSLAESASYENLMLQATNDNLQQAVNAQAALEKANAAMLSEQQSLRADLKAANERIEKHVRTTAELLQRVTRDGNALLTQAA